MNKPKHRFPNDSNWLPNGGKWDPKEMLGGGGQVQRPSQDGLKRIRKNCRGNPAI